MERRASRCNVLEDMKRRVHNLNIRVRRVVVAVAVAAEATSSAAGAQARHRRVLGNPSLGSLARASAADVIHLPTQTHSLFFSFTKTSSTTTEQLLPSLSCLFTRARLRGRSGYALAEQGLFIQSLPGLEFGLLILVLFRGLFEIRFYGTCFVLQVA